MEFEEPDELSGLEEDSSLVFFSGHAKQLQNDSKIVSASTPTTIKEITIVEYASGTPSEVKFTYEAQMIKNTDKYVYFFSCGSISNADDEEYGPMESPLNGVFVKINKRPRRRNKRGQ